MADFNLKTKILFVAHNVPSRWLGGTEVYSFELAHQLKKTGLDVSVLHPHFDPDSQGMQLDRDIIDGIETYCLRHPFEYRLEEHVSNPQIEEMFKSILDEKYFDIIHFQHIYRFPAALIKIAKDKGLPVCMTLHDHWAICPRIHLYNQYTDTLCDGPDSLTGCSDCILCHISEKDRTDIIDALLLRLAYRQEQISQYIEMADIVVSPTRYLADKCIYHGIDGANIEVSPLGMGRVAPKEKRNNKNSITFGYLGKIDKLKNVTMLVDAFRGVKGDAVLNIRGNGANKAAIELIDSVKSDHNIQYSGAYTREELPAVLSEIDIAVFPSLRENYPVTVREALRAGVPVIASKVGGIPEIVADGESGLLFDPRNIDELRGILQSVVDDPSIIERLKMTPTKIKSIEEDSAEWILRYKDLINESRTGCALLEGVLINAK